MPLDRIDRGDEDDDDVDDACYVLSYFLSLFLFAIGLYKPKSRYEEEGP
jgi:hypothetical protein